MPGPPRRISAAADSPLWPAGIQFQLGRIGAFGMYQITTSPKDGKLLSGPTHTFSGGLRFSLGGSKEGVAGGGY